MAAHVAVAVAVLVDVLDLVELVEGLVAVDRVDVADAQVIAAGAIAVVDA